MPLSRLCLSLRGAPLSAVMLAAVMVPVKLSARPGAVTGPESVIERPGDILAASAAADGSVLLAGWFTRAGSLSVPGVVRLKESGEPDPAFSPGVGIAAPVTVPAAGSAASIPVPCPVFQNLPGGGVLLGDPPLGGIGSGVFIPSFWFVMDPDGDLDLNPFPAIDSTDSVQPQFVEDGKLTAVVTTTGSPRLRRLRLDTGRDDPAFSPVLSGRPFKAQPAGGGKLWVLESNPFQRRNTLRLLEPGGAVAPVPPVSAPIGTNVLLPLSNGAVVLSTSNKVWQDATSRFEWAHTTTWYGGDGQPGMVRTITGGGVPLLAEADGTVLRERVLPEGVSALDGTTGYTARPRLISRDLPNGEADTSFRSFSSRRLLDRLADGRWQVDGTQRYLADGSADPSWTVPAVLNHGTVRALYPAPGGAVIGIGDFTMVNGQARPGIARWRADGVLDSSFVPSAAEGGVLDSAVASDNSVLLLRGGSLQRLLPDGSADSAFHLRAQEPLPLYRLDNWEEIEPLPGDAGWLGLAGGSIVRITPEGVCSLLHLTGPAPGFGLMVLPDGRFFHNGMRWLPDGTLDMTFIPPPLTGSIPLAALAPGQWLFTQGEGSVATRTVAVLGDDGAVTDSLLGRTLPPGITAAAAGGSGALYTVNGDGRVVRRSRDGRPDVTFSPLLFQRRNESIAPDLPLLSAIENGGPAQVRALLVHPVTGQLWVAGDFTRAGDTVRSGLAILDAAQPGTFAAWRATVYAGGTAPGAEDDTDGDGLTAFQEYAAGTDPHTPDAAAAQATIVSTEPLTIQAPQYFAATDVVQTVELSADLTTWRAAQPGEATARTAPGAPAFEITPGSGGARFVRIRYRSTAP